MSQPDPVRPDDLVFAPHRIADPGTAYTYYERFREAGPTAQGESTWPVGHPSLALLRFEDVHHWLRDPRLGKEWRRLIPPDQQPPAPAPGTYAHISNNFMLFRDPPDHTRLRSTANMAFTPRHVARMREPIERTAQRLADDLVAHDGPADLITTFAYPLPVLVIAGILGIPEEDFARFRDWAAVIAASIDLPVSGLEAFVQRANQTTGELTDYFRWIVGERRREPQDDLISSLIAAEDVDGKITEDELIANIILLLVAGHETTVNLIGNGTLALLTNRDQWRTLVEDPSLARNATEELLRYDSPVQLTTRIAMEDMEILDHAVPRGTEMFFVFGSANRDPRIFEHPDRLDIRRQVGRIMSFGMGIHFCLGAPLARLEGEIAFRTLATAVPGLELATDTPEWRAGVVLRGLQRLPVEA